MNRIIATFSSYAELVKFFNENKSKFCFDDLKAESNFYGYRNPAPLLLVGVTELVVKFTVREQRDWKDKFQYWYVEDFAERRVKSVKSGKLYQFYSDNKGKKSWLSLCVENDSREDGFEFEESAPNCIGKPTEKKLQAWFDYLDRKEAARQAYMNANTNKREQFLREISSIGEIRWDNKSHTEGRIVSKYFTLKFQAQMNGYCNKEIVFNSYMGKYDLDLFKKLVELK